MIGVIGTLLLSNAFSYAYKPVKGWFVYHLMNVPSGVAIHAVMRVPRPVGGTKKGTT